MADPSPTPRHFSLLSEWGRALIATGVFLGYTFIHSWQGWPDQLSVPVGVNIFALAYLVLTWLFMLHTRPSEIRSRAQTLEKRSYWWKWLVSSEGSLTFVIMVSFLALAAALNLRPETRSAASSGFLAINALTILIAWLLFHTGYALYYAYLYYRHEKDEGGLDFPGETKPDYLDFAYFAFTVGVAFSTSDVEVTRRTVRRTVLGHSILSFVYNTVILALVVNLVLGV